MAKPRGTSVAVARHLMSIVDDRCACAAGICQPQECPGLRSAWRPMPHTLGPLCADCWHRHGWVAPGDHRHGEAT